MTVRAVLDRVAGARLCVVGDLMLDEFLFGSVDRISPEAPVPVFLHERSVRRVGGAGTAASALAGLCAGVEVVGVVGDDEDGAAVTDLLRGGGVRAEPVVDASRPTIRKTRVVARDHHLVRLDREVPGEPAPRAADLLVDAAVAAVDRADAVLVSDYVKGVCGRRFGQVVLRRARERGVPVVVDSKRPDLLRYRGVTAVTPNEREMDAVAGHLGYSSEDGPNRLRRDGGFEWVVVTRAEHGMSAFGPGVVEHFPARARTVADVAGAGDAVAGALALALGAGLALAAAGDFASLVAAAFIRDREDKTVTPRALLDLENPNHTGGG